MKQSGIRQLWRELVDEKFKDEAEYYQAIIEKLKRLKFTHYEPRHSSCTSEKADNPYCVYCYTQKHFPNLLKLFKVRLQADIPARAKRTRLEHHSPKQNQLRLDRGNQLPLF